MMERVVQINLSNSICWKPNVTFHIWLIQVTDFLKL